MEMYDLGYERPMGGEVAAPKPEKTKVYPGLTLNDKDCPFLKDKKQGDTGKIVFEYRITGTREAEGWDDVQNASYLSLDLQSAGEEKKSS